MGLGDRCFMEDWYREPQDALWPGLLAAWHGGGSWGDPRRNGWKEWIAASLPPLNVYT